jgi:hypothetical protein
MLSVVGLTENIPASAPPTAIPLTVSVAVPGFETVSVAVVELPTSAPPTSSEPLTEIAGWVPVPVSDTEVGLVGSLLAIESEAAFPPVEVGSNVTVTS